MLHLLCRYLVSEATSMHAVWDCDE